MYQYLETVELNLACVMQHYKCIGEDINRPLDEMNVSRVNVKINGDPVPVWRGRLEESWLMKLEEERELKRKRAAEKKRAKGEQQDKPKPKRRTERGKQRKVVVIVAAKVSPSNLFLERVRILIIHQRLRLPHQLLGVH